MGADPVVTLYLVRHGQAQWQIARDDDLDSGLSPLGHRQSRAVAERVRRLLRESPGGEAAKLFTSPLRRARQTGRYLQAALGIAAEILPALSEAPFRVADRLPSADAPFEPAASGEPAADYEQFRRQATEALRSLFAAATMAGAPVVAVSHGGLIKTLLRVAAASDGICFEILNTGITILEWREGRWVLAGLSCCEHLETEQRSR